MAVQEPQDFLRIGLTNLRDWLNILDRGAKGLNMEQCKTGGYINIHINIINIIIIISSSRSSSSSCCFFSGVWLPLVWGLLCFATVSLRVATCALMRPFIQPSCEFCTVASARRGSASELYECDQHTDTSQLSILSYYLQFCRRNFFGWAGLITNYPALRFIVILGACTSF